MTSDQLRMIQEQLGITCTELAEMTGRTKKTVSLWRSGVDPVPQYVQTILRQQVELQTKQPA